MCEIIFWSIYTIMGVWAQFFVAELDFFAPGIIICLQKKKYSWLIILGSIWLLIQEGTGTLAFGAVILQYAGLIIFYFPLRSYLSSQSPVFIITLSLFSGTWIAFVLLVISKLQELTINSQVIYQSGLINFLVFPIIYFAAGKAYKSCFDFRVS